ncbi:alpha/beta fold hydrolase [Candidatus Uabimicrobium amorphum]|uniref:Alpha/beta hydrolase n=1 Tax=Uabimicrobium amorphum TaxID=2596890 RepID=A0A5S9ITT6_UABAM|nr:alpha/beta hydrolase [Candidatus Uabimicrobium amorphum]BBM87627.1 alpha/beta hydrolase [Candidatus Uabimicrobium amorphum]
MQLQHKQIQANGVKLHVVEGGNENGDAIIFLHGFPDFWYGWQKQIAYFVEKGYRVIAPDQRGYNLSDKPRGVRNYHLDTLTSDIVALMDNLHIDQAYVVGHDWGGGIAWWLATNYPQRVKKLVICNMPHLVVLRNYLLSSVRQMCRSWYMLAFQVPFLPERIIRHALNLKKALRNSSKNKAFSGEDLVKYQEAWSQKYTFTAMINWYRAGMRYQFSTIAKQEMRSKLVEAPTMIIWGKKDAYLSWKMVEPSAKMCKSCAVHYIDDATHWVHREYPEDVNRRMDTFFTN